ncbi:unnamed protein product, partial [Aureobasidium mustum]
MTSQVTSVDLSIVGGQEPPWAARSSYYASLYSVQRSSELVSSTETLDTPTLTASVIETTAVLTRNTTNSTGLSTSFTSTSTGIPFTMAWTTPVRTPIPPLTTIFTAPGSCSTRPFTLSTSNNSLVGVWGLSSDFVDPCYPDGWATAKENFYSPGACPEDHTYASIVFGTATSDPYTMVNCCSSVSGMELWDEDQCLTLITTSTYFPIYWFGHSLGSDLGFTRSPEVYTKRCSSGSASKKEKQDAGTTSSGLSVGIGIGVALGMLISMGVIIFAVFRIRKKRAKRLQVASNSSSDGDLNPELPGDSSTEREIMAELDDQTESKEMEGDAMFPELEHLVKSSELEVPHKIHELPG